MRSRQFFVHLNSNIASGSWVEMSASFFCFITCISSLTITHGVLCTRVMVCVCHLASHSLLHYVTQFCGFFLIYLGSLNFTIDLEFSSHVINSTILFLFACLLGLTEILLLHSQSIFFTCV